MLSPSRTPVIAPPEKWGLHALLSWVLQLPYRWRLMLSLGTMAAVAAADLLTGSEFSLSFFYLPPLMLVAWSSGPRVGIPVAVTAAMAERFLFASGEISPIVRFWNSGVRVLTFVAVIYLLEMLKDLLRRERELSRNDFLTGLLNSRAFYERAEVEIERSRRYGSGFVVLYLDCDNFKTVNDTLGHERGDELLRLIAHWLRDGIRTSDAAARLGGDEFALLLVEVNPSSAEEMIQELHRQLTEAVRSTPFPVTFSAGAVYFRTPPESVPEMVRVADELMYAVKRSGKNAVQLEVWTAPQVPPSHPLQPA